MSGSNPLPDAARHLSRQRGRAFWRGLEELADTEEFRRWAAREFPGLAETLARPDRRSVLKVMGASLALAGLAGCDGGADQYAVPYVDAPEFNIPGKAKWYATAALLNGYAQPVLGETHEGRPTKLEGNPHHPASEGATDAFTQAAVLGLYDPDRSRAPLHLARPAAWDAFETAAVAAARRTDSAGGAGFRLLTGAVTSPTLARQIRAMREAWPAARHHVFEPAGDGLRLDAARLAFGRPLERRLHLDAAEAVVSLDDDVLGPGPHQTWHARGWSRRRTAFRGGDGAAHLLVAEPTPTITGVAAAHRLAASPERIGALAEALAAAFGMPASPPPLTERETTFVDNAARALDGHRGRALVTVGAGYPVEIQALVLALNVRLGNAGRTLRFTEPLSLAGEGGSRAMDGLAEDMAAGRVETLAVLGANPVYTAPADIPFADLLRQTAFTVHAGLHADETAVLSDWHLPLLHELESWSDARAVDGHVSILQPLVRPFSGGRSSHAILDTLRGARPQEDRERVQATWAEAFGDDFERRWAETLVRGFIEGSAPPTVEPEAIEELPARPTVAGGLTVEFRPDPCVWDGRHANNAWLQELPKPLTKATWDNVVLIAPALAERLGVASDDAVTVTVEDRAVTGPAFVLPGQDPGTLTVFLGYGRGPFGRVMDGAGYDAYRIRPAAAPWHAAGTLAKAGRTWKVATTQLHYAMDGFDFIRTVPAAEAGAETDADTKAERPTLYPVREYDSPAWGMSIDLDACIGCNACVVACMAENNVPVVGKEEVAKGREMHWLRVDRYYEGPPEDPVHHFQPVPCMHCEKAPCEMGCPVNATTHSPDGLNQQIYNRCIGTRTCSSYCPYKVRRFNWFDYTGEDPPSVQAQRNPNVTVRDRGVMEKCTYCVQRIRSTEIEAKIEGRPIRDGEVKTACQQACPASAIVFGDVASPDTAVSRAKRSSRDYSLLEEANTWPRTTYLAKVEDGGGGEG